MDGRAEERLPMRRALPLLASAAMLTLIAAGCGDGGAADSTSTPSPTPTMTATATASAATNSLREADFSDPALVGPLIDAAGGGEVPVERIEFVDLIGNDGVDEAVVVVESGGTLGDLGAGVFTLAEGKPELVQFIATAGRVEVRLDLVVTIEGVWAPDDAQCCPSELLETSYQWDGTRFAAITEQVVPNPTE
jgi:hypothetical protein